MRVVLHAHSTWSYDGQWSLPAIARLYGALGVRAVMMSEHDTGFDPARFPEFRAACAAASTRSCRLIPGIEYSSPDNDIHILTWGLADFLAEHRPVTETLEAVRDAGGVAVFAHPVRRAAWRKFDPDWASLLCGIELWNRKSDGITWGREARDLIAQTGLPATVGQDFHRLRHLYPLTMTAPVPADGQDGRGGPDEVEAALVAALRAGRMVPDAFRRPLLRADGTPRTAPHDTLEALRARVRDLVRNLVRRK